MIRQPQFDALQATFAAIANGQKAGLWCMPTGVGKTFCFTELARLLNQRTLVLVHRDELIEQTLNHFARQWPMAIAGVVKAERDEWQNRDVVVASVQSLTERWLEKIQRDLFGLVVADECHHLASASWSRVTAYFQPAFLLGCTATPDRLDGKGLSEWFGPAPLYSFSLRQAIDDGYLVRISQFAVETDANLDSVASNGGDFVQTQLADAVNTAARNKAIVAAYQKHAKDRRAIAFCVDIAHAFNLAFEFTEAGFRSCCVTGTTPMDERRDLLARFAAGKIQVLTNCLVATEGFDDPDIDCVLWARPTKSRALYTQGTGRGLRLPKLNKSKKDCLVLDVTDNCRRHKLVTVLDLFGVKAQDAAGEDVLDLADAEEKAEKFRQEELVTHIKGPVRWRLESVCPWPKLPELDGYSPRSPWQREESSDKQLKMLRQFGLEVQANLTRGEASYLIDRCVRLEEDFPAPATPKQEWALRYMGLWEEGLTKKQAGRLMGVGKKAKTVE